MLRTIRSLVLGAAVLGAAFLAVAGPAEALTKEQKAEFEGVIREYLLKNPEVVQEAMVELERRQREAEAVARARITKDPNGPLLASKHNVVIGNPNGNVTLVEFFDYNCGYCKRGLADMQRLVSEDKNLRVIMKDFPILSPGSRDAAAVALAVKQQVKPEKYWEFHVKLMSKSGAIGKPQALEVAKEIGADFGKLELALAKPDLLEPVEENRQIADSLGLTGTPSYVLGDEVVVGAVGYDQLKGKIESIRKCGKSQC